MTTDGENGILQSSSDEMSVAEESQVSKGFTAKNLDRHYNKHGAEYPDMSKEDYGRMALELANKPISEDILGYTAKDGAVVRYAKSTNDFVKAYPSTGIASMYKPKDDQEKGYKYFLKKQKEEGIDDD